MTLDIVTPAPRRDFNRDRWGRPLIDQPDGSKPIPYKRCTSYVGVLEDRYNLELWQQRMAVIGISQRDDLRLAALAHLGDKSKLNGIVEQAREAAKASSAATTGTAYHALTDLVDRGETLPDGLPPEAVASMEAYRAATADLRVIHIEHPVVLDTHRVAGTPDRIVEYQGERYIADTKTGTITFGTKKIAMQLAVYARSYLYDVATGARDTHGASLTRGIIYHVPAGQGSAELRWIDLEAGWEAVKVARDVWRERLCDSCQAGHRSTCSHLYDVLTSPFGPPPRPSLHAEKREAARDAAEADAEVARLERMIRACPTADDVRALWTTHAAMWTDALTEVARAHIASLPAE